MLDSQLENYIMYHMTDERKKEIELELHLMNIILLQHMDINEVKRIENFYADCFAKNPKRQLTGPQIDQLMKIQQECKTISAWAMIELKRYLKIPAKQKLSDNLDKIKKYRIKVDKLLTSQQLPSIL
jgi:hypothetical protein